MSGQEQFFQVRAISIRRRDQECRTWFSPSRQIIEVVVLQKAVEVVLSLSLGSGAHDCYAAVLLAREMLPSRTVIGVRLTLKRIQRHHKCDEGDDENPSHALRRKLIATWTSSRRREVER